QPGRRLRELARVGNAMAEIEEVLLLQVGERPPGQGGRTRRRSRSSARRGRARPGSSAGRESLSYHVGRVLKFRPDLSELHNLAAIRGKKIDDKEPSASTFLDRVLVAGETEPAESGSTMRNFTLTGDPPGADHL